MVVLLFVVVSCFLSVVCCLWFVGLLVCSFVCLFGCACSLPPFFLFLCVCVWVCLFACHCCWYWLALLVFWLSMFVAIDVDVIVGACCF